jgi:3-methyladenine DNA glycosylase/8-oxoguanine DNA glycosylase
MGLVTSDSGRAVWLRQARSYLRDADPVLARLIDDRPAFDPRTWLARLPSMDLFGALVFHVPAEHEVLAIAEKWRPYRSLAVSYLFSAAFESAEAEITTTKGEAR